VSTRVKIFISYLVMGIVPVILFFGIIIFAILRSIAGNPFLISITENHERVFRDVNLISGLEIIARDDPGGLFDTKLLSDVDEAVSRYHVGIALVDNEDKVFYASEIVEREALLPKIQSAQSAQTGRDGRPYNRQDPDYIGRSEDTGHSGNTGRSEGTGHSGNTGRSDNADLFGTAARPDANPFVPADYYTVDIEDSEFTVLGRKLGGDSGTLYIAVKTGAPELISDTTAKRFFTLLTIGIIGLIVLMTFLVTRGMMRSLKMLKNGVRHISEGDLDFSVRTDKRDEVAQVIMAFEEMRLRLKASIEAQIREDENRREFAANISHDLRTPVTAIKGYVEGLMDGTANTPEKRDKYMNTILSKTIALERMIDDLFLYSSLDVGKANYNFETVKAADFYMSLCSETKLDLEEKGFEVQSSVEIGQDTLVRLDRNMIQRLQHNLTENAAKYCRETGRRVVFSAYEKDGEIICSTEDNGVGIQPEALPHIFERFYRADAARSSSTGGTGLGLQIARRIAEDHGGRIWAESTYGEYTRISWALPVESSLQVGPAQGLTRRSHASSLFYGITRPQPARRRDLPGRLGCPAVWIEGRTPGSTDRGPDAWQYG
jgi:signal transduction histidine kinase